MSLNTIVYVEIHYKQTNTYIHTYSPTEMRVNASCNTVALQWVYSV